MRIELLASLKTGMTRLRQKGGASPTALYDLVNGWIDQSGAPVVRQGTLPIHRLPALTEGLCYFNGKFVVFSHVVVDPGSDEFVCIVLRHPSGNEVPIRRIWFSEPFVGQLYVVAEFEDDSTYHYFAADADVWEADTFYLQGGIVQPTAANGFTYTAARVGEPGPAWAPGVAREVGDIVEPTVYNGYYYECIATYGDNPASGPTEPTWPTSAGAQVIEETSGNTTAPPASGGVPPPGGSVPPGYTNPGGSRPPGTIER